MARIVDCRFQRFSCGHDLFQPTYTRSNRTKGTKIMRCFPHCCPEHMPRCYCGCSLQVLVTFNDIRAINLDDLVVCARFETSEMQEPRHRVDAGGSLTVPSAVFFHNVDDVNATTWILAEKESEVKQREVSKNSVLYVLNNHRFPRWYYGYESGATKNQREMKHHLTAYILHRPSQRSSDRDRTMQHVRVVGRLTSPAFTLVSYRRARGEVKRPVLPSHDDPLAALEDGQQSSTEEEDGDAFRSSIHSTPPKRREVESGSDSPASTRSTETRIPDAPMPSMAKELARRRANSSPFVIKRDEEKTDAYVAREFERNVRVYTPEPENRFMRTSSPYEEDLASNTSESGRKRKAGSPGAKGLWWRRHAQQAQRVVHFHVLYTLLSHLSLRDVQFCLRDKSEKLRQRWFTMIANKCTSDTNRLDELARAFCLSIFSSDGSRHVTKKDELKHAGSRAILSTCVDVLVEVLTSSAVRQLIDSTWEAHERDVTKSEQTRENFVAFLGRIYDIIEAYVQSRRKGPITPGGGIAALVDDAVSTTFRENCLFPLRREMAKALSDSGAVAEQWYEAFVAQMRVMWVHHHERKVSGISLLWQAAHTSRPSTWNGKWLLDASSFHVRRPHRGSMFEEQPNPPLGSVMSWALLLRQWTAIELTMDGTSLTVTSLLDTGSHAGMRLILDQRERIFKSFPDGLASAIFCGDDSNPWLHGDYKGQGNDECSEIKCETHSLRQTSAPRACELLRVSTIVQLEYSKDRGKWCSVTICISTATTDSTAATSDAQEVFTWPVAARHQVYNSASWTELVEVRATYCDLK